MTDIIKPAATILLARENDGTVEVLLLKRNKALVFAGGLWVFPGGKIEKEEIEDSESELEAAKRAAIRETQEEAQISISSEQLTFFRHWTTPAIAPRRYGTWFFFAAIDESDISVVTDDDEIKGYCWITAQEALNQVREGKMGMMPPTLLSLQMIKGCKSLTELRNLMNKESPIYILPASDQNEFTMMTFKHHEVKFASQSHFETNKDWCLRIDISRGQFEYQLADGIELQSRIHSLAEVDL